ncbi:MAG TPA: glucosamine-6-phosphate deaminase [Ginsengibacter sp.]
MQVAVGETYKSMSEKCADDLLEFIQSIKDPLLCTASGDTPKGMYAELIKQVQEKKIDISNWHFIGLDEWAGMNGTDEGSCRYHLDNDLFRPLQVAEDRIIFFDGRSNNLQAQCDGIEDYIHLMGGIDVAILGLGMNGHVGMNEPGTLPELYSHVADIDAMTQAVGQKYFKNEQQLTKGLTLGLATLQEASFLMLLANGNKKAAIIKKVLEADASPQLPATLLITHKKICIYLDKEAAALITKNEHG